MSRVIRLAASGNGHSSRPYLLYDIEADARSLLVSAREKARAIIGEAKAEAETLLENLRCEAEEEARKRGYEAGLEEGKKAVFENHMAEFQQDVETLSTVLRSMKSSIEEGHKRLEKAAECDLVALALAVAEKIIGREVSMTPEVTTNVVRRAVGLLGARDTIELLVNPEDVKLIETYLPELKKECADLREVQVVAADSVSRGGCVARAHAGSVDARIESQVDQIAKELFEELK